MDIPEGCAECSYGILALWFLGGVGLCDLSFPVSPFNVVFKAVRREGLNVALLEDFGFSSPQRPVFSRDVGCACLHRALEKGPCETRLSRGFAALPQQTGWAPLGRSGSKCLQPSKLSIVHFTGDSPHLLWQRGRERMVQSKGGEGSGGEDGAALWAAGAAGWCSAAS